MQPFMVKPHWLSAMLHSTVLALVALATEGAIDTDSLELVWYDDFVGGDVDWDKWVADEGDGCDIDLCDWGNSEKQVRMSP